MKVAQHFSAGLASLNASVPEGTVEFRCHGQRTGRHALFDRPWRDGSIFSDINPAINCWATFIASLPPAPSGYGGQADTIFLPAGAPEKLVRRPVTATEIDGNKAAPWRSNDRVRL